MKKRSTIILYLGTTKLSGFVAEISLNRVIRVLRQANVPAMGLRHGIVVDIELASRQVRKLIQELSRGGDLSKAVFYVVLSNPFVKSYTYSSSLYFQGIIRSVSQRDVNKVIAQTKSVATVPLDEVIIQAIPQYFIVDDIYGIKNPVGLEAKRLAVLVNLFTIDFKIFQNIRKILEINDIEPAFYLPQSVSLLASVLDDVEKNDGGLLINMGGFMTELVFFKDGFMRHSKILDRGSEDITRNFCETFKMSEPKARKVKEHYLSLMGDEYFEEDRIPINDEGGNVLQLATRESLKEAAAAEVGRLFEMIMQEITLIKEKYGEVQSLIFTGGGARVDGMLDYAAEYFQIPARLGLVSGVSGPQEVISNPRFSTSLGTLKYLRGLEKLEEDKYQGESFFQKLSRKTREWIEEYF